MSKTSMVIHQFSPACAYGDGVTNGLLFTQKTLRRLGYTSEIFVAQIPQDMRAQVQSLDQLVLTDATETVMIIHHSMGHKYAEWVESLPCKKIILYHNITPAHFFTSDPYLAQYSELGREQLKKWADISIAAIGVSPYNCEELKQVGYQPVADLPLLVDIDKVEQEPWEQSLVDDAQDTIDILFIGRIAEHKCQHDLLEIFAQLLRKSRAPLRLILVGGTSSEDYLQSLKAQADALQIAADVVFAGKVSNAKLYAHYRAADVFVCMSEHEGFGMPLIEAMIFDLPVIAYKSGNIGATLGEGGILFTEKNHARIAACIQLVIEQRDLRRRIIRAQRKNLQRFSQQSADKALHRFLHSLGLAGVAQPPLPPAQPVLDYVIEGPFDSSYSLALVNRNIATALEQADESVALHSTEGGGDFAPDPQFIAQNPSVAQQWQRSLGYTRAGGVVRNLYPPRVTSMRGEINALGPYGWEESAFPAAWSQQFNHHLDLVLSISDYVRKTLQDNGVTTPIATVGNGADHILAQAAEPLAHSLGDGFRFLHVSSGFPRKGIDVLLAAYSQAFNGTDDVTLIIKTFSNPHNDTEQQIQALRARNPQLARVIHIEQDLSLAQIATLYQNCHALVAPSRGEGFGLPMAEAMLFDLPVITTAYGGQREFCCAQTAWLIDYHFAAANSHHADTDSVWVEPDCNHLAELLAAHVTLDSAARTTRTEAARARIASHYRWADVARRTQSAMAAVSRRPMLPSAPRIGWISTWNTRCGIATYSEHLSCAFPPEQLIILANTDGELCAKDGANVRRCWDSRWTCDTDELLQTIVDENIDRVVIQFNFGFMALSTLANLLTQLQQRNIRVFLTLHATSDFEMNGHDYSLSMIQPALSGVESIWVHSIEDLNQLKQHGLTDNTALLPHGVLPPLSTPPSQPIFSTLNARIENRRVIACYGFLLPHKGVKELVEAFHRLRAQYPTLHLLLLNARYPNPVSDETLQAVQACINQHGLDDVVTMSQDYLDDPVVLALLGQAEWVVYPYQHTQESASGAVRLGLASGAAVACTPLDIFSDLSDVVETLPGTSPEAIAEGLEALLNNPQAAPDARLRQRQWCRAREWPQLSARLYQALCRVEIDLAPPPALKQTGS